MDWKALDRPSLRYLHPIRGGAGVAQSGCCWVPRRLHRPHTAIQNSIAAAGAMVPPPLQPARPRPPSPHGAALGGARSRARPSGPAAGGAPRLLRPARPGPARPCALREPGGRGKWALPPQLAAPPQVPFSVFLWVCPLR